MLNRLTSNALKKRWRPQEIADLVGPVRRCWLTHAVHDRLRSEAASGGTTTAVLAHALATGAIDGAVVCVGTLEDGRVRARFCIARTEAELIAAQGSKYVATRFLPEVLPLIHAFDGRVAVVGLACDLAALARRTAKDPALAAKVALTVGLVCGHSSDPRLIDHISGELEREAGSTLTDYRFRVGHWRGRLRASFRDGSVLTKPSSHFNLYQNLYFFAERKCLSCAEHFALQADLVTGDVWSLHLKDDPTKHTGVIVRSVRGEALLDGAVAAGFVAATPLEISDILDGQARSAPTHHNVSARRRAGRMLGIDVRGGDEGRAGLRSTLVALILLANFRFTQDPRRARWVFRIPRPALQAYLVLLKGLESLH